MRRKIIKSRAKSGSDQRPVGTPNEGGIFSVRMSLGSDFPFQPSDCRFLTRVYHPNIDIPGISSRTLRGLVNKNQVDV
jgi:ubiquitin-protein ligase